MRLLRRCLASILGSAEGQRAKPRCALKSTHTQITSLSPSNCGALPIKDSGSRRPPAMAGSMPTNTRVIKKMKLFRWIGRADFHVGQGATSKATMCPEINEIKKLRSRPQGRAHADRRSPGSDGESAIESRKHPGCCGLDPVGPGQAQGPAPTCPAATQRAGPLPGRIKRGRLQQSLHRSNARH